MKSGRKQNSNLLLFTKLTSNNKKVHKNHNKKVDKSELSMNKNMSSLQSPKALTHSVRKNDTNNYNKQNHSVTLTTKKSHKNRHKLKQMHKQTNTKFMKNKNNKHFQSCYQCLLQNKVGENSENSPMIDKSKLLSMKTEPNQIISQINNTKIDQNYQLYAKFEELIKQNQELFKANQLLVIQKQYYKHKTTLLEIDNRNLRYKINEINEKTINFQLTQNSIEVKPISNIATNNQKDKKKQRNIFKTEKMKESQDFKLFNKSKNASTERKKKLSSSVSGSSLQIKEESSYNICQSSNVNKNHTEVSSLLISLEDTGRMAQFNKQNSEKDKMNKLFNKIKPEMESENTTKKKFLEISRNSQLYPSKNSSSNQNLISLYTISDTPNEEIQNKMKEWHEQIQEQFTDLLQSVQIEHNSFRKATLRKMLALKAIAMKKYSLSDVNRLY